MIFRPTSPFYSVSLLGALGALAAASGCTVHHYPAQSTVSGSATGSVSGTASVDAYAEPTYVTVQAAPPPLKEPAVQPAAPSQAAVWVSGHWAWEGRWVWVDGRWEVPRDGYVWEPPVAVSVQSGGYQYHRGHWRRRDHQPPRVYRTDGTIRVHTRREDQPPRAARVVIRSGEPPRSNVVVRSTAPRGPEQQRRRHGDHHRDHPR